VGAELFPCGRMDGRTDRHDEAITRFLQFLPTHQKTSRSSVESAYDLRVKRQGYITTDISPSHSYKCVSEHLIVVPNVVTCFKIGRRYKDRVELKL
jgi:hypothetical protein